MAAPTIDNPGKIATAQSFPQTIGSFTVGSGANRFIFFGASYFYSTGTSSSTSITTVKFNTTESLTFVQRNALTLGGGGFRCVELWYLKAPSSVTAGITATYNNIPDESVLGATSWFGVDQTTPLGTLFQASLDNTSTAPTVNVTGTTLDQIVHDILDWDSFPGLVTATGTQAWNGVSGGNATGGAGQYKSGTGGTVTMNWTLVHTGQSWNIFAVGINGIAAAAGNQYVLDEPYYIHYPVNR